MIIHQMDKPNGYSNSQIFRKFQLKDKEKWLYFCRVCVWTPCIISRIMISYFDEIIGPDNVKHK